MFERCTASARQALVYAQEECGLLGDGAISGNHLLLGMMRLQGCVAGDALAALGLELEATRAEVARVVPPRPGTAGAPPLAGPLKDTLKRCAKESMRSRRTWIAAADLLMHVTYVRKGIDERVLAAFAVTAPQIREELAARMHAAPPEAW